MRPSKWSKVEYSSKVDLIASTLFGARLESQTGTSVSIIMLIGSAGS